MTPLEFISTIGQAAQEFQLSSHIFASVTLAQGALETGWGKTIPVDKNTGQESFNLFGVKGTGPAGSVLAPTQEFENGQWVTIDANFRAYHSWEESIADHAQVLLLDRYAPARAATDPKEQARQIQACGYATDPTYADKLIQIMDQYNLYKFNEVDLMNQSDVQAILKSLGALWQTLSNLGLDTEATEIHRQANALRSAYGLPTT